VNVRGITRTDGGSLSRGRLLTEQSPPLAAYRHRSGGSRIISAFISSKKSLQKPRIFHSFRTIANSSRL
jgi:hypothetical protein